MGESGPCANGNFWEPHLPVSAAAWQEPVRRDEYLQTAGHEMEKKDQHEFPSHGDNRSRKFRTSPSDFATLVAQWMASVRAWDLGELTRPHPNPRTLIWLIVHAPSGTPQDLKSPGINRKRNQQHPPTEPLVPS